MKPFGYLLTLSFVVLIYSCTETNQSGTAVEVTEADEATIRTIITDQWPTAYETQDTVLLSQLLHKQFQLVDDQGDSYNLQDELSYTSQYGPSYDSFAFEIKELSKTANGTVVVTGEGTIKGIDEGTPYTTTYTSSNVLVKEGTDWKILNSHVSGVSEERE